MVARLPWDRPKFKLNTLPVDVLIEIASYLSDAELVRLSILCRALRFLAEEREIVARPPRPYLRIRCCNICKKDFRVDEYWCWYHCGRKAHCSLKCALTAEKLEDLKKQRFASLICPGHNHQAPVLSARWRVRKPRAANTDDLFEERDFRRPSDGARK